MGALSQCWPLIAMIACDYKFKIRNPDAQPDENQGLLLVEGVKVGTDPLPHQSC